MLQPFLYAKRRYRDSGRNNQQNKIQVLQNCFQQFNSIMTQQETNGLENRDHCTIFCISCVVQSRPCPPVVTADPMDPLCCNASVSPGPRQIQTREWRSAKWTADPTIAATEIPLLQWHMKHMKDSNISVWNIYLPLTSVWCSQWPHWSQICSAYPKIIPRGSINLGLYLWWKKQNPDLSYWFS